jgi:hypothetical protein
MCEFEDMDLSSPAGRHQPGNDSGFVEVLRSQGKAVVATSHIVSDLGLGELLAIWREFRYWERDVKPTLPIDEQQFATSANGKRVWVIEDTQSYTILYPEDY